MVSMPPTVLLAPHALPMPRHRCPEYGKLSPQTEPPCLLPPCCTVSHRFVRAYNGSVGSPIRGMVPRPALASHSGGQAEGKAEGKVESKAEGPLPATYEAYHMSRNPRLVAAYFPSGEQKRQLDECYYADDMALFARFCGGGRGAR